MKQFALIAIFFVLLTNFASSQSIGLNLGDIAPEISLPDFNGKTVNLSSFRNKIVLIDFWGTWCAPCVKEQPHLAELYMKYKTAEFTSGSGFEIFGVSLDNQKKQWTAIIKKYKISWTQVSDLKFWLSPVTQLYAIQELPYNVLIDGKGTIIGKNLHGEQLDRAIEKLLK